MIRENKKLPKDVQGKIPELAKALTGDRGIVAIYLFGSFAKNAIEPLSDLDFGVLLSERMKKPDRFDKHLQLIGLFTESLKTEEIDLIHMNNAPINICFQIIKTGKLLLCNDKKELVNFNEFIIQRHLDFNFIRETFDSTFLEGIGYHG